MLISVTGSRGFIGNRLTELLKEAGLFLLDLGLDLVLPPSL
jgi:nucleoside-diphosphate-sugar epimerase